MSAELKELAEFAETVLAPAAHEVLGRQYNAYCAGADIGIEIKADATPASMADRQTEEVLRALIEKSFPGHGIWGEELGASGIERDYVWVLDPLDGTKEFLARKPGCFGTLIGLLYKTVPVCGVIGDPLNGRIWSGCSGSTAGKENAYPATLSDSVIACTNPEGMFPSPQERAIITAIEEASQKFITRMNCIGFAGVAGGSIDIAIESRLGLHDIAALIPVLRSAGCAVIDFNGNDYREKAFDLFGPMDRKYDMIAAKNETLAAQVLEIVLKRKAA